MPGTLLSALTRLILIPYERAPTIIPNFWMMRLRNRKVKSLTHGFAVSGGATYSK